MTTETRLAPSEGVDYRANGRTVATLRCPFCDCLVEARTWSLAGSGKRCECGAVLQGLVGGTGHRGVTARRG